MNVPSSQKHLSSSILLWIRQDKPRQDRMDYWKGPHSKIISANLGQTEYRQIHLAEKNSGLWPVTAGIETSIPADRKVDGIAEVTFKNVLAPIFQGKEQTKQAFKDEINIFKRTILYIGLPGWSRWYDVVQSEDKAGSRIVLYIRRKNGVSARKFRKFINTELIASLVGAADLKELRSQVFTPWQKKLWDSPNVLHDNPTEVQFHAQIIVGFKDQAARDAFLRSSEIAKLSNELTEYVSAVHAYDVTETLTFVKNGKQLPKYEEL